jgi:ornithine carbamoyltransferase
MRHFLADDDLSSAEQIQILDLADEFKNQPFRHAVFAGPRSVAVLFDKPTLRTQASFAAGIAELGGYPMIVDGRLAGIGVRESIADTARVRAGSARRSSGARSARIGSKRWRSTPEFRSSTR